MLLLTAAIYAQNNPSSEVTVTFHNFPWGTSLQAFMARMGNPAYVEEINGLRSLVYDNIEVSGYPVFLIAYFSQSGLEGGTYYFDTITYEERIQCYTNIRSELLARYGSTHLNDIFSSTFREMAPYESSWDLPSGYVHLKVDTRRNDPVTLWFSSPALTRILFGS
jgi:hypothetical protein